MKRNWKKFWVVSVGAMLVIAGCQTAKVNDAGRSPAMGGHRQAPPPDDSGDSGQAVDNTPVNPPTQNDVNAATELVRISTVNGVYNTDHGATVEGVHAGDVVQLSADVFNSSGDGFAAENRSVEEFTWTSVDSQNNSGVCIASSSGDCLDNSLFQVNDYGVSFYVPQNFSGPITITVFDANSPASGSDQITLNPAIPAYVPPTVIIASPSQYSCPDFNEDCALARQGNWVYIDGARYFVPFTSDPQWAPYQHGYWTWVDGDGWTWVSYDQWGWYTDHYGYWRHHGVYGWIWSPFDDRVYRPAAVSWYYNDGYVGWYPYYDSWNQRHPYWGPEHGFDDGYWGGYHEGGFYNPYHPGFYHVAYGDFGSNDVYAHRPANFDGPGVYGGCYESQHYGAWPGGRDIDSSHSYMNTRSPNVMVTHVDDHQYGNQSMRFPVAVRQVPDQYKAVPGQDQRFGNKPIPVGAVFNHDQAVPPTDNHRGITAPPVVRDDHNPGNVVAIPPHTQNPAHPNGNNPVYHPPVAPAQPAPVPVYHPGQGGGSLPNPHPVTPGQGGGHPVTPPNNGGNGGNGGHGGGNPQPVNPNPVNGGNGGHGGGNPNPVTPHPVTPPPHTTTPPPRQTTPPETEEPSRPVENNNPQENNGNHGGGAVQQQPARPPQNNGGKGGGKPPRDPASVTDTTSDSDQ